MVDALFVGIEIDFTRLLLANINEIVLQTITIYPFPYMIFVICRDVGVPILHNDIVVCKTS